MFAAVFPPAARRTNGAAMWAKARRGNGTFFYRKLVPQRRGAPCAWSLSKPLSQGLARATWRLRGEAAVPQLTAMVTAARATTSRAAVRWPRVNSSLPMAIFAKAVHVRAPPSPSPRSVEGKWMFTRSTTTSCTHLAGPRARLRCRWRITRSPASPRRVAQ